MLIVKTWRCSINLFLRSIHQRSSSLSSSPTALLYGSSCRFPPYKACHKPYSSASASQIVGSNVSIRADAIEESRECHQVITAIHPLPIDMHSAFLRNLLWSNGIYVLDVRKSMSETTGFIQTSAQDQEKLLSSIRDIHVDWGILTALPAGPATTTIVLTSKEERKFIEASSSSKKERISHVVSSSSETDLGGESDYGDILHSDHPILFLSNILDLVTMQITLPKEFLRKRIAKDLYASLLRQGWAVPNIARTNCRMLVDIGGISVHELKRTVIEIQPKLQNHKFDIVPLSWTKSLSHEIVDQTRPSKPTLLISSLSPTISCRKISLYLRTLIPKEDVSSILQIDKNIGECTALVSVQTHQALQSVLNLDGRCFGGHPVNIQILSIGDSSIDIDGLEHEKWSTFRIHNLPSKMQEGQIRSCLNDLGVTSPIELLRWDLNRTAVFSLINPSEEAREIVKTIHGKIVCGKPVKIEILPLHSESLVKNTLAVEEVLIQQRLAYDDDYREHTPEETQRLANELSYLKGLFASYAPKYLQLYSISQAKFQSPFKKSFSQDKTVGNRQTNKFHRDDNQRIRKRLIELDLLSVREIIYHPSCGLFTPTPFDFDLGYNPPYMTECAKMYYEEVKSHSNSSLIYGLANSSKQGTRLLGNPKWAAKFGRIVQGLVQNRISESYAESVVKDLEKQVATFSKLIRAHLEEARSITMVMSYIEYCRAIYHQSNQEDNQKTTSAFCGLAQDFEQRLELHKNNLKDLQKLRNEMDNNLIQHGLQPCVQFLHMLVSNRARAEYVGGLIEITRHPTHGLEGAFPFDGDITPNPPYATKLARSVGLFIRGTWWQKSETQRASASTTRLQTVLRSTNIQNLAPVFVPPSLSKSVRSKHVKAGRLIEDPPKRMTVEVDKSAVRLKQAVVKSEKGQGKS